MKSTCFQHRKPSFQQNFLFRNLSASTTGFTFVEIIVVIAIIGILAGIAFPVFTKWLPSYRAKGAAQLLYADLQKAKMHAIKTNRKVKFNFITTTPDCSGPTGYTFTDNDGTVVVSTTHDDGICFFSSTFINNTDGFDPKGLSLQVSAIPARTIKVKHTNGTTREYVISQSMAGSITIK